MARVSCDGSETEGGSHVAQILPLFPGAAEKGAWGQRQLDDTCFLVNAADFS